MSGGWWGELEALGLSPEGHPGRVMLSPQRWHWTFSTLPPPKLTAFSTMRKL